MSSKNLLEIKGLHVNLMTVGGIIYAVQGVNLEVREGEIHGIVGESGCGKSMTIKSVMRLHDEKKTEYQGEILFQGEDILQKTPKEMQRIRGKEVAMIFQDPMVSLNPIMKVGEQIAELIRAKENVDKKQAKEKALQMIEKVGVLPPEKRYEQYPFEMSGGMMQRIMIAMGMSCQPRLLIADEPTTALDVTIQAQILDLMKELQQEHGTSIMIVTHNLGVVAEICDRVTVMYAGKVVETADVAEIFDSPKHPYTLALMKSRPKDGEKEMISIPGAPPGLSKEFTGCAYADRCEYATERCRMEIPNTVELEGGHKVACHRYR